MLSEYRLHQPTECHLWQSESLRPEDVDDALELVETWTDESHHSKHLCRCRRCGQLYVNAWCEIVDWDDGDDQTFTFYIPVQSAADIEQVKAADPPPMSLDLLAFFPRINENWQGRARKVTWIGKPETHQA
jgi:hypothetical protein